jgi:hypothetical protein
MDYGHAKQIIERLAMSPAARCFNESPVAFPKHMKPALFRKPTTVHDYENSCGAKQKMEA